MPVCNYHLLSSRFCLSSLQPQPSSRSQAHFFNVVVLPLYMGLASALPSVEPLLAQVRRNHAGWVADMTAGFVNAKPTLG